ncbi:MAG: protein kinase [Verrucomicrobiota bacterium]
MHSDLFHPEKLLAAGPSAKIYRGVETATGRKVLIKVLLEDHESSYPLDRERLQLLAHSLLHVRHPQIAGLITMIPTEEEFALVYEFVPGISGRALPTEKRLSAADMRALAVQLLHAMMVGEHMRLPHGDLKPSNLIVADHPGGGLFLQVQDWGISMARAHPTPETMWFAAPERLHGMPPGSQSDLFTAAATLFYLATGTAPAQGSTPQEILADWAHFDARGSIYTVRPDMDQPLVDWLSWLLQRDPAHRPHSVGHALDVLMRTMHTGFTYQPAPAPQMAPGAATGPLVPGGQPNAAMPRAPAPRPVQQAQGAQTGALARQAPKPSPPKGGIGAAKPQSTGPIGRPQATGTLTKPLTGGPKLPGATTSALRPAAKATSDETGAAEAVPAVPKKPILTKKGAIALVLNLVALVFVLWFFHVFDGTPAEEDQNNGEETVTASTPAPAAKKAPAAAPTPAAKKGK